MISTSGIWIYVQCGTSATPHHMGGKLMFEVCDHVWQAPTIAFCAWNRVGVWDRARVGVGASFKQTLGTASTPPSTTCCASAAISAGWRKFSVAKAHARLATSWAFIARGARLSAEENRTLRFRLRKRGGCPFWGLRNVGHLAVAKIIMSCIPRLVGRWI